MSDENIKPEKPTLEKKAVKSPFNPYDLVIIGYDDHPGIAADTKADPALGISAKEAEKRRKLYVQLFDERAFLPVEAGMLASVKAWGVQDPIKYVVYDGTAYTINGRQRIKAARTWHDEQVKLGIEPEHLITIPGDRYSGDIDQLFAMSRVLNIHVEEPTMMKARSMQRLLMEDVTDAPGEKTHKRTVQQVAAIYGCSDQHVRDMVKLFGSSDTVKKALETLAQPTIGLLLAGLTKSDGSPDEEKQLAVLGELQADKASGKKVTVAGARGKVQDAKGKVVNSPKDKVETTQRALESLADTFPDGTGLPKEALLVIDTMVRALWAGNKAAMFPKPIKDQKPGYTLGIISKLGD